MTPESAGEGEAALSRWPGQDTRGGTTTDDARGMTEWDPADPGESGVAFGTKTLLCSKKIPAQCRAAMYVQYYSHHSRLAIP
jgi:hypothetical protein